MINYDYKDYENCNFDGFEGTIKVYSDELASINELKKRAYENLHINVKVCINTNNTSGYKYYFELSFKDNVGGKIGWFIDDIIHSLFSGNGKIVWEHRIDMKCINKKEKKVTTVVSEGYYNNFRDNERKSWYVTNDEEL